MAYVQVAILYKGPAQNTGKLFTSNSPAAWEGGAVPVTQPNGHSFAVALTHVVGDNGNVKFLAYNNVPPAVPNVKTKSNSKGVIIINTAPGQNDGTWIVHTVPGFPAAKTGYSWPAAEIAKGHLLICMSIAETQINAVAASLIQIEPFVYYNDIPETETAGMPDFKKLAEGQIPTTPPFTTRRSIKTAAQAPVDIHIYSKSAKSKYEIYKKVIVKALKRTIKVWSRRDNKLKGDCRVLERNIRLIKSPAQIGDHPTNIEADESNWIVSEPGNIFCFTDKPYSNLGWQFVLTKIQFLLNLMLLLLKAILYKGPTQANGKVLLSTAPGNWADGAAPLTNQAGHSIAGSLTGVVANAQDITFLAYNNVPPAVPNVQTKSNSKGVIIVSTAGGANEGRWIVHTVPGFPAAKTGYNWPAAETAKGHLLICMTIAETQINAIASSLIRAEPFVYYNDIPESETAGMADFKKLAEGQTATLPPFTIKQSIKIVFGATPIDVRIYSKSAKSRYEFYKKVILKKLKKTIKVWSRRDNKLKGDCRVIERNIRLIKSPAQIGDHPTNIEADQSSWIVSEPGNIFCFTDKPYAVTILKKSQATEPAMAVCIDQNAIFARFDAIAAQTLQFHKTRNAKTKLVQEMQTVYFFHNLYKNRTIKNNTIIQNTYRVILYKGPAQNTGKLLASDAFANWDDGARDVAQANGHSFAATLTDVVGNNNNDVKFLAYNNVPPGIPNVKTKSNGKGIIIIRTTVGQNDGAWIVHTVPGFPAARTGYSWPAAEIAKGHLLICMTIAKTQINAIAASLFRAEPFVYYNDIPETETAGMPDFKKLAEGQIPTTPPFTISRTIKLTGAGAVPVHIYSKSAKSRYEMYRKVILRGLKKTIKVWSRRDNKLKGDCRVLERNIRLIKSPVEIAGHPTNIEADESNWIVSEPGNIFCFMDKPYTKSQSTEPALAACFDQAAIFARFNTIAAQI
ncbi:Deoxyribonuclease-2-alpha [Trichinella nelsoni]|uniref:Deoxyribonuclease-2-alpha n=1 Tax=Trichinella nelsoni TaxID=6336 RepID=A0A0V0SN31_9BILA|nr:Deoxyribonuclease-2-alpha [Trichinella nelsoni]